MNDMYKRNFSDSSPSVTLTVGDLRDLLRSVIDAALRQHAVQTESNESVTNSYFNVAEAADFLRVAASTIRLYIRKGQLKPQKIGRRVIISRIELETFLARADIVQSFEA